LPLTFSNLPVIQAWPALDAKQADQACCCSRHFQQHWQTVYPQVVNSREKDLPDSLNFHASLKRLWKKLRTTNAIERSLVEVRRPTRPIVVLTNVQSAHRIISAIFYRFNKDRRSCTLKLSAQTS
jgi:transposase-like protein